MGFRAEVAARELIEDRDILGPGEPDDLLKLG